MQQRECVPQGRSVRNDGADHLSGECAVVRLKRELPGHGEFNNCPSQGDFFSMGQESGDGSSYCYNLPMSYLGTLRGGDDERESLLTG